MIITKHIAFFFIEKRIKYINTIINETNNYKYLFYIYNSRIKTLYPDFAKFISEWSHSSEQSRESAPHNITISFGL